MTTILALLLLLNGVVLSALVFFAVGAYREIRTTLASVREKNQNATNIEKDIEDLKSTVSTLVLRAR